MKLPIRIAVVGGKRGQSFTSSAAQLPGKIKLVAICDVHPQVLDAWRKENDVRIYSDYQQVLEDPDIDAVCIATPIKLHARQAIAALQAGKHVLSEVTAAWTLDECHALVAAAEASDRTYMMAENCCYFRHVMMVDEMVRRGVFGELTQAEGDYIHAIPEMSFDDKGELTWRGDLRREEYCNPYPTHSLGPICKWLGVNGSDPLKSTATWQSRSLAAAQWVHDTQGEEHPLAQPTMWRLPDTVRTMIRTRADVLIEHRVDWVSARPHNANRYALQGTRASFMSNVTPDLEPLVWIGGRSPTNAHSVAQAWEPLYQYADEFEHPLWREHGESAQKAGHGGADYFVIREFASAIIEGRPPYIDVYDAVTWSSITPLSALSLGKDNAPVMVPDFKTVRN